MQKAYAGEDQHIWPVPIQKMQYDRKQGGKQSPQEIWLLKLKHVEFSGLGMRLGVHLNKSGNVNVGVNLRGGY